MATRLRKLYEVLNDFSTATHIEMCNDLLRRLKSKGADNLASYFADALEANSDLPEIKVTFIPVNRGNKTGRNPVTNAMSKETAPLKLDTTPPYEFKYLHREVPHLRAASRAEQQEKGWIDYVAHTTHLSGHGEANRPILGEVKWHNDENPLYAFVQLLTYLSEIATPNQIARGLQHQLFGSAITAITSFDLHIFLGNFNDRGEKGQLIDLTRQLAFAFKQRLQQDHPETAHCLESILCISGQIESGSDQFSDVKCLWMV